MFGTTDCAIVVNPKSINSKILNDRDPNVINFLKVEYLSLIR